MKLLPRYILAACLALVTINANAQSEFHASNELSFTNNAISGEGKSASGLIKGNNYLEVLSVYGSGKMSGWDYSYNTGLKATDDIKNDPKHVSLTNIQAKLTDKIHTISLGDTFESFSQYSLATSLKGGSYRFSKENSRLPEITAVFGWAYPRWDSLWRDPEMRTLKRQGMGARIKQTLNDALWAGASFVGAKDTDRQAAADQLYDAKNYTFDMNYAPMPGLTLTGEHSISNTGLSPSAGGASTNSNGNATKIEVVGDADPSRVSIEYENVEPDFFSALGSATPDRRKIKTKWRYKHTKNITVNSGLLWYRNNLDSAIAAGTTRNWKPELGVAVKKIFPSRPYSFADLSYKFDRKYGAGQSGADHYMNANYRDRLGELDTDTNVGYTLYRTETSVRKASEINFNTSLNSRHNTGSYVLKPALNLGSWYSKDDLADTTDKIYEYSLGLGVEAPDAGITGDLRFGQNMLRKSAAGTDDSTKSFAAFSTYWRPKPVAGLTDLTLFVRANLNDFAFTTSSRDFREKSVTVGMNTAF